MASVVRFDKFGGGGAAYFPAVAADFDAAGNYSTQRLEIRMIYLYERMPNLTKRNALKFVK